jgi:DUF4097 and DUF4098 domain-containing protein YvlB
MKRTTLVLAAALAFPVALAAQTAVDQKRPAAPDGSVSIENFSGSVKVTGWPKAEVQVKGTIGDNAELDFGGSEKQTRVAVEPRGVNPMSAKGEIEVFVPAGSSVSIEGFQATITIAGVGGAVSAETVNGTITHDGPSKEVRLQSVNGAVTTTRPSGRVHVEAVNGPVTVREATGELVASTVNGKLTVAGGSFNRVSLESVSGGVLFEGALEAKATLHAETVSGSCQLVFPAGFAGDFSVSTFSGAITNQLGPAAEKKGEFGPGSELRFTSAGGGAHVSIETLSGAIEIRKK